MLLGIIITSYFIGYLCFVHLKKKKKYNEKIPEVICEVWLEMVNL